IRCGAAGYVVGGFGRAPREECLVPILGCGAPFFMSLLGPAGRCGGSGESRPNSWRVARPYRRPGGSLWVYRPWTGGGRGGGEGRDGECSVPASRTGGGCRRRPGVPTRVGVRLGRDAEPEVSSEPPAGERPVGVSLSLPPEKRGPRPGDWRWSDPGAG